MKCVLLNIRIHSICYCEPEAHPPTEEVRTIKFESE